MGRRVVCRVITRHETLSPQPKPHDAQLDRSQIDVVLPGAVDFSPSARRNTAALLVVLVVLEPASFWGSSGFWVGRECSIPAHPGRLP